MKKFPEGISFSARPFQASTTNEEDTTFKPANATRFQTDIEPGKLRKAFDRVVKHLRAGDFRAADVKKLRPTVYYRAKLSEADRLLFRSGIHDGKTCILLLELIEHHADDKSRFLNGSPVDESKLDLLVLPDALPREDALPLTYINPRARPFRVLGKILSFDDSQQDAFRLHPPFILIGSAGSGKTVLTHERLKQLPGTWRAPFPSFSLCYG